MQLSRLSVALRPRQDWSAIDHGFTMAQHWFWPMAWRGALLLLPILCVAIVLDNVILGTILIWWFKPLYERLPMTYLSVAVFDETIAWKDSLRGCFDSQLFLALTCFRLSYRRTANTAITLERLNWDQTSQRKSTLFKSLGMATLWLVILGFILEIFSSIVVYQILFSIFEETTRQVVTQADADLFERTRINLNDQTDLLKTMTLTQISVFLTIYSTMILVVVPFHVSAGYALYVNQRTKIEGWDIEVGFNKLLQRLGLLSLVFCLVFPGDIQAESTVDHESAFAEVKASEDFNHDQTIELPADIASFLEWLKSIFQNQDRPEEPQSSVLAPIFEVLVWIVVACLVVYFCYQLWLLLPNLQKSTKKKKSSPATIRVSNKILAQLPADILLEAQQAWNNDDPRRAYSLLYLGSIRYLRDEFSCEIGQEETERECLRRTSQLEASIQNAFREILLSWQRVAYGGFVVQEPQFQQSLRTFNSYFATK